MTETHDQPPVRTIGKRGQELKLHREMIRNMVFSMGRGAKFVFAPGVRIRFANGCTNEDRDFIGKLMKTRRST